MLYICSHVLQRNCMYECGPLWVVKWGVAWVRWRAQSQRAKTIIEARALQLMSAVPNNPVYFNLFCTPFQQIQLTTAHADNSYTPLISLTISYLFHKERSDYGENALTQSSYDLSHDQTDFRMIKHASMCVFFFLLSIREGSRD